MIKIIEKQKQPRLVLKRNWTIWKKAAGILRNKKLINHLKWQRKKGLWMALKKKEKSRRF